MEEAKDFIILIIEIIDVSDPETFAEYRRASERINVKYGARPLARGMDIYEGSPQGVLRMVSMWPSKQAFIDFQESPEYQDLKTVRKKAASANFIICEPV